MQNDAIEIEYAPDSADLFQHLIDLPCPVFLDSGLLGRYDILTAAPRVILSTFGPITRIQSLTHSQWSFTDPFSLVRQYLPDTPLAETANLPFTRGAIGYFSYDLGQRLEDSESIALKPESGMPDMIIGIYDWAIVRDHQQQQSWLTGDCPDNALVAIRSPAPARKSSFRLTGELQASMDRNDYTNAFNKIQAYIRDGDCYQVNLARKFSIGITGHPWEIYRHLRTISPAPYSAYLGTPYGNVLSSSPERFVKVSGNDVESRPIKGTRPRATTQLEDQRLAEELENSPKDRAENVMIVDLLRHDLGKTCEIGTIKVPTLAKLESFSNVHHLVSTITGKIAANQHATDVLRACFPGGSITGAPKIRAMQIIDELEPERRGVYCGAIGYIDVSGNMDTNIAIRTMTERNGVASFWAGGGIVADSVLEQEYQEIIDKAQGMFTLLEQASMA